MNPELLEQAAASMRRLNHAFADHDLTDEQLHDVLRTAEELRTRLVGGPRFSKGDHMAAGEDRVQRSARLRGTPVGGTVEFDPFSLAAGKYHPGSVGLTFTRESEDSVVATTVVAPMFQGPPDRVHGGVTAMLIDEVMGVVNSVCGAVAFTGRLEVSYRAPAPIGVPIQFRAWLDDVSGRKRTLRATGSGPDGVFAEATGLFITVDA